MNLKSRISGHHLKVLLGCRSSVWTSQHYTSSNQPGTTWNSSWFMESML